MVRSTCATARHKRRKRLLKLAKGFWGDRKNHIRLTRCAVMKALKYNYYHRKLKKRDFRNLWVTRIGIASKMEGLSYSKLICGLKKANIVLNRKMLSEIAISDFATFKEIAAKAKAALA